VVLLRVLSRRNLADPSRHSRPNPRRLILLQTLCHHKEINSFGIKQIQTLLQKYRGGAVSTISPRLFTHHPLPTTHYPLFSRHLFSRTYELPPPPHRFASLAFSSNYELLFSQLPCFQKHLRCPLLFFSRASFQKVAASFCETSGVGVQRWPSSGRLDAEPASESGRYIQTEKGSEFMGLGVGRRR
jgi:hypothetical protein